MNLYQLFQQHVIHTPQQTALVVKKQAYTYADLNKKVLRIAGFLQKSHDQQIGLFASRSLTAYAGILGILAAGKTYVAFNKKFSKKRLRMIIEAAGIHTIIADWEGAEKLASLGREIQTDMELCCPQLNRKGIPQKIKEASFRVFGQEDLPQTTTVDFSIEEQTPAYIIFTSGSTGKPKGVPVSHHNVWSYVHYLKNRYDIGPEDRFSQVSDLTFDASVHDMFLCWTVGASLYPIPEEVLMAPAQFIKKNKLTTWFSIPSLAQFMKRFRMLKPNAFPHLRYSLFGGESLHKSLATAWQKAAPNSVVENQYGASEITVGLSHYVIPRCEDKIRHHNGVVSVGQIFDTQDYCLLDKNNTLSEEEGEICLTGSQITKGYWQAPQKTDERYFKFPGDNRLWFKTGDILKKKDHHLFYVGRKDFQVKIRGFRIELEEINHALRKITGTDTVYTLPYPVKNGITENLYSFVVGKTPPDKPALYTALKNQLTTYMVPREVFFVDRIPLNIHGKTDRHALINLLNTK